MFAIDAVTLTSGRDVQTRESRHDKAAMAGCWFIRRLERRRMPCAADPSLAFRPLHPRFGALHLLIAATLALGAAACSSSSDPNAAAAPPAKLAKNIVLFLGDGTGLATIHAASVHGHGKPQAFYIHSMPHMGLSDTSAVSTWNTDSAAGMTAIVTGQKTHVGVVSQGPAAKRGEVDGPPLKTILEYAEEHGLATGVVSNSPITDATPAACYAHSNERDKWGEIFSQIADPRFGDGVDVVIGPGRERIRRETAELGFDAAKELPGRGYQFIEPAANLDAVGPDTKRLVALFENEPQDFPLAAAVDKALSILESHPKGFFLMVESNNHYTDIKKSLDLMVQFDAIIEQTAERLKGTGTLIVFTADHSFDIHFPLAATKGEDILPSMAVAGKHTAEEVLVLAQGPGAERVKGFFPNTHLFEIMMSAYGWAPN